MWRELLYGNIIILLYFEVKKKNHAYFEMSIVLPPLAPLAIMIVWWLFFIRFFACSVCIGSRRIFHPDGRHHRPSSITFRIRRPAPVLPAVRLRPSVLRSHIRAQGWTKLGRRCRSSRVAGGPQVFTSRPVSRRSQRRCTHIQSGVRNGFSHLDPGIRGTRVSLNIILLLLLY